MGKGMAQKSFILLLVLILVAAFVASFYSSNTGFATRTISSASAPRSTTLNIPAFTTTKLTSSSLTFDMYELEFSNGQGSVYTFPYLAYIQNRFSYGTGINYGNGYSDLVFVESASPTSYNIGLDDYVVLSDQTGPFDSTATSHVLYYKAFDPIQQVIVFTDMDTSRTVLSYTYQCGGTTSCFPANARIIRGGNTYYTQIDANGNLAIDQNADGSINGRKINLVAEESGKRFIIDLGYQQFSGNGLFIVPSSTTLTFLHSSQAIISKLTLQRATIAGSSVILLQQATTPN